MGYHTFDAERAETLEEPAKRYRSLSAEELLWALSPTETDTIADLGSGTGFYTDDVSETVQTVYAVDVQEAMHEYYKEKGVPENVELVTSGVSELPLPSNSVDGVFSTMTYHEFPSKEAVAEIRRILCPGGVCVVVDWAASGNGDRGPPVTERFSADETAQTLENEGLSVTHRAVRPETFLVKATAPVN